MTAGRAVCVLAGSLTLLGCDRASHPLSAIAPDDPPPVTGTIVPQPITLAPLTTDRCAFLTPFTTAFDLVIDQAGPRDVVLDQVTLRLTDGSSVGGSPVLMSAADLAARFGSTRIRSGSAARFRFTPRFECAAFAPRSLHADVVLRDGLGVTRMFRLVVPVG
jgi:hypothetical protein